MSNRLSNYEFGMVTLDGQVHTLDLFITAEGVVQDWQRRTGHSLVPEDIAPHLLPDTHTLIIGSGARAGLVVPGETIIWCSERGITVESLLTREACARFNELNEDRGVAAGLHLTC